MPEMLENTFLYCALGGGLFLGFQFIMLLMGMSDDVGGDAGGMDAGHADAGGDAGMHHDAGGDVGGDAGDAQEHWSHKADGDFDTPDGRWFFELFSLRSIAGAVLFFGLVGKSALAYGVEAPLAIVYATLAGLAALYAMYWIFKQVFRLESQGNEDVRNAIGRPARVYIPIPPAGEGVGKVQFKMQNRIVEYQAVSDEAERLGTGANVIVTDIVSSSMVKVKLDA